MAIDCDEPEPREEPCRGRREQEYTGAVGVEQPVRNERDTGAVTALGACDCDRAQQRRVTMSLESVWRQAPASVAT